jgi:hypothetical protein
MIGDISMGTAHGERFLDGSPLIELRADCEKCPPIKGSRLLHRCILRKIRLA